MQIGLLRYGREEKEESVTVTSESSSPIKKSRVVTPEFLEEQREEETIAPAN